MSPLCALWTALILPLSFRSILKIGPVQSVSESTSASDSMFTLSPQSQGRVVSALQILVTLARSSGDDVSVGQIIVDAGALPALLFIFQSKVVDAEILRLGCEILDGLSGGYASETLTLALASSDFIKVLIKLAGFVISSDSLTIPN